MNSCILRADNRIHLWRAAMTPMRRMAADDDVLDAVEGGRPGDSERSLPDGKTHDELADIMTICGSFAQDGAFCVERPWIGARDILG